MAFQQLGRRGGLAGHDVGVVEGRHERAAALAREALGQALALLPQSIVVHQLRAVCARPGKLRRRGRGRHHDDAGHTVELRRERHRLRVVPGGVGHHAARADLGSERGEEVPCATELERARALEALALEEHARAAGLVQLA